MGKEIKPGLNLESLSDTEDGYKGGKAVGKKLKILQEAMQTIDCTHQSTVHLDLLQKEHFLSWFSPLE